MIVDHHQRALAELLVDAARGVREQQHLDAEPAQHADRKRHGAEVVPLVVVHAPRQREHPSTARGPGDERAGVADNARGRPVRNRLVPQRLGLTQALGEAPEAGAENDGHLRDGIQAAAQVLGRLFDVGERQRKDVHSRMAAMQADAKLASVPASMARKPSLARSWRRSGTSAPMPPI